MTAAELVELFSSRLTVADAQWRSLRSHGARQTAEGRGEILALGTECKRLQELLDAAKALLAAERDRRRLEAAALELLA